MPITFVCSTCGKKLKTKDDLAGKRVVCPYCQAKVVVPSEVLDAEIVEEEEGSNPYQMQDAQEPAAPVRKKKSSREDDDDDEGRRPCPMCGEMIRARAGKCRFCGEVFDPELRRLEGRRRRRAGDEDASLTAGDWVLAILCSGIGCICGIVWTIQGKPKGVKMLAISFGMVIFWNIVNVLIQLAAGRH